MISFTRRQMLKTGVAVSAAVAVGLFLVGGIVFRQVEQSFADVI